MMQAPAAAQAIPSATMASTVSGIPGCRPRLHGPFKAASIQVLCIATLNRQQRPRPSIALTPRLRTEAALDSRTASQHSALTSRARITHAHLKHRCHCHRHTADEELWRQHLCGAQALNRDYPAAHADRVGE